MILCIGEAVIDMFQKKAPDFEDVFIPLPGGCSYNTSIAIGKLFQSQKKSSVGFLGRISKNFFGDIQIQRLRDYNVNDNLIIRCDENPILAFIKTEEGKEPQYAFYDEGTADRLLSEDELESSLQKNPDLDISCLVFGSVSMAMEPVASSIEDFLIKQAKRRNAVIAFDPNIRPFLIKDREKYLERFKNWASLCTIAKISSEDFEYIFPGIEPEEALQKMLEMGTNLAIVTLGCKGAKALLRRGDGSVIQSSADGINISKTGDTVGAGDTFHGAFLAWLELRGKLSRNAVVNLSENDLHDALFFANKAAAVVCTRYGAQPPSLDEIKN
ncbi:MAG: carbohydrate kinase [Treponema sp.]|nr:carbohydrate kinase [Treponema sp.]